MDYLLSLILDTHAHTHTINHCLNDDRTTNQSSVGEDFLQSPAVGRRHLVDRSPQTLLMDVKKVDQMC